MAWLRAISGTISNNRLGRIISVPTIVFETWTTDTGIVHRMKVPWQWGEFISRQLRLVGISVGEDDRRPNHTWTRAVELGMKRPSRTLRIISHADLSGSLLASVDTIEPGETVLLQWVLTPAPHEKPPARDLSSRSDDFTMKALYHGVTIAHNDELEDRRRKLEEPNFQGVGRVAAIADTEPRAASLISRVTHALGAANSNYNYFEPQEVSPAKLIQHINDAATPTFFPAQFSISELSAVIAWPIGQPLIAGLPHGPTRHLYATEDVPRVGRVLGDSNYPGHERPVALGYDHAAQHMYVGGSTGVGKSTLMANSFAQDVARGYGGIVIDASNSDSNESLFSRALGYIPPDRLNDVVILDVNRSRSNPVGFNVLDQGNPRIVVDQLTDLFGHLYQDTKGVWTRELMFHGLYTLAETPGMTFIDIVSLLTPRTPEEIVWADGLKRSIKDPELKQFWQRWENFSQTERDRHSQPLLNRAWQLISRPETRNIIGQSVSSFKMTDLLRENKILLVSLAGLPVETSSLLGTILVNALWTAAQTMTPDKPNFLYLDEFQLMTRLPMGLGDMLARARKHKLGVVLGTQYLEDLPVELRNAVINNARSRVIFQSSAKEARTWQNEFGRQYVSENDFIRIRKYEAIAQLVTDSGIGAPITLRALAPMPATGVVRQAIALSDHQYGRNLQAVERQIVERRTGTPTAKRNRPPVGERKWDE
ncbi:MAG: type IV secretory system conjugative DNA transfer family protein [Acidobacteria bacterium]|nr:type IV secretory system conjugative DNA transfer family protein [Acidobacteriota bacterium]